MVSAEPMEIDEVPELVRIAEEVRATGRPRLLRRDGEAAAALTPLGTRSDHGPGRVETDADREAFIRSAGSWQGVDVEQLSNSF